MLVVVVLVLFDPALIMVDHLHLQFTGMSIGLLLISVSLIKRGTAFDDLAGFAAFNLLALFDLRFLWLFPLYMTYMFRHYCFETHSQGKTFLVVNQVDVRILTQEFANREEFKQYIGPQEIYNHRRGR